MKAFLIVFLILTACCFAAQIIGYLKHNIETRFANRGTDNA